MPATPPAPAASGADTYLASLNPNQREAVATTDGPLLVLAGAGSGKTKVLVTRIAHLVQTRGVAPSEILAITFTKKAAVEMRERLAHLLDPETAGQVTLATFHALGAALLREYGPVIGLSAKFGIADEVDVAQRVRNVLKTLDVPRNAEGERPRDVIERVSRAKTRFADLVARRAIADPASAEDVIARFRAGDPTLWAELRDELDAPDAGRFASTYAAYQAALAADQVVDYDDLIVLPLLLFLQRPEVLRLCTTRWTYLLVDEYQDTDYTQDHLLRLLAGERRNLCVVGDDDQAIYSWRGAKVENIRTFPERYAPCACVTLDQNYRSSPIILEAANAALAARPEPGRLPKVLWTARTDTDPVRVWHGMTQEAEAYALAADVRAALDAGAIGSLDDVLVLYRLNALARPVEEALRRSGVPYRIVNGHALHERKEVRDLVAYLKVVENWFDLVNFERAAGTPARGIGPATIEALAGHARVHHVSPVEAARQAAAIEGLSRKAATALGEFAHLLDALTGLAATATAAEVLQAILAGTGFREHLVATLAALEADEDDEEAAKCLRRLHDVDDFVLYVEEFCRTRAELAGPDAPPARARATVAHLLDDLAAFSPDQSRLEDVHPDPDIAPLVDRGAVTLMSVHTAKGLEAPRVYVLGLEEKVFPALKPGTVPGEDLTDPEVAEEGRLFYVAMTRARRHLILSAARTRELQRGAPQPMVRSRFLHALPETIYRTELYR